MKPLYEQRKEKLPYGLKKPTRIIGREEKGGEGQSRPLPQQRHQPRPQTHQPERGHHNPNVRPAHRRREHELVRHQFHQTGIDQNPRADAVEHPVYNQRRLTARRPRLPDAQADGDRYGGGEGVSEAEDIWRPALALGPWRDGQSRPEPEPFEGLVEDEDDVEGFELVAGDGEGEADKDGVEDDAELEDEDGRHLRGVVFEEAGGVLGGEFPGFFDVVFLVVVGVAEVVVTRGMGGLHGHFPSRLLGGGCCDVGSVLT